MLPGLGKCYLLFDDISNLSNMDNLTHFRPLFHFSITGKCQKTFGFLTFSGDVEKELWSKMCLFTSILLKEKC